MRFHAILCTRKRESNGMSCALAWKNSIYKPGTVKILPCDLRDLEQSWEFFRRKDLHKLSAVDATSFAVMKRARIRLAFTFDHHFAVAGFRMVA